MASLAGSAFVGIPGLDRGRRKVTLGGHWVVSGDISGCLDCGCSCRQVSGAKDAARPPTVARMPQENDRPSRGQWGFTSASATQHCMLRDHNRGPASLSAPGNIQEGPLVWLQGRQSRGAAGASVSTALCTSQHRTQGAEQITTFPVPQPFHPCHPGSWRKAAPNESTPLAIRETRHSSLPELGALRHPDPLR